MAPPVFARASRNERPILCRFFLVASVCLLALLGLLGFVTEQAFADAAPDSTRLIWKAGWVETELEIPPESLRVQLPRGWIRPREFEIYLGPDRLARGVDFLLDPRRGTVRMLKPVTPGSRFRIAYPSFPFPVQSEYRRHRPFLSSTGDSLAADATSPVDPTGRGQQSRWTRELEQNTRLEIAGSKTFSVEVGSQQDLSLKQSLDLSVSGRIGREVKVRAILTDRETPLQPEGTSTQLQDFDRVLMEVEGPGARMTLGDYVLTLPSTEFSRYSRQLEGVRGEITPRGTRLFGAGATSPGEFLSIEFFGEEGKQGPYRIHPGRTSTPGLIVAGSESVWLEGRRLVRGENEDYVIDYTEGTLTFTGRTAITAYTRIAVDFQFSDESYRKSVYAAGFAFGDESLFHAGIFGSAGGMPFGSAVDRTPPAASGTVTSGADPGDGAGRSAHALRLLWLDERDDRRDPIGLSLTEEEKEALRRAGDGSSEELESGIRFVGAGNGEYEEVFTDTLATPFFVYVGPENGDYQITFQDVGVGEGDYADSTTVEGILFFHFVGRDEGRFLPGRELSRPESARILSVSAASRLGFGLLTHAEIAVSEYDANTFSSLDDSDNQGTAILIEGRSDPIPISGARVTLGARFREIDARFHSLDRLDASFFALDWNVDPARLEQGDRRLGLQTAVEAGRSRVALTLERLDNLTDFQADRSVLSIRARPGPLQLSGRVLRTLSKDDQPGSIGDGRRSTDNASLVWPGALLQLRGRYTRELNSTGEDSLETGGFYREGVFRIGTGHRFRGFDLGFEWTRRNTYTITDGSDQRIDVGDTGLAELEWKMGGGRYLSISYTRRELRPRDEREKRSSQIGRVRWLERRAGGLFQQEGRWELATSEQSGRAQTIEFVGEGEGHYDSLGVYQGIGDYEVLFRELTDAALINRIDASFRTEIDLSRRSGDRKPTGLLARLGRSARLTHYWTARVESDRPPSYLWPRMLPVLLGARPLPLVEVQMRADLTAVPDARWLSPRIRWERRKVESGTPGSLRERTTRQLQAVRFRSRPLDRWSADVEQEWQVEERVVEGAEGSSVGGRSGWRSYRSLMDHKIALAAKLSLSIEASYRHRDRIESPEVAEVLEATPALIWIPKPRSRIELRTTRTSVNRRGGSGPATRDLERPGWNSRFLSNIRLREALDLTLFLRESRPDDGRRVRDARVELRATF